MAQYIKHGKMILSKSEQSFLLSHSLFDSDLLMLACLAQLATTGHLVVSFACSYMNYTVAMNNPSKVLPVWYSRFVALFLLSQLHIPGM